MKKKLYATDTPWEPLVGYSRAVRVGSHIQVSGTTATNDAGEIVGVGDPYRQAVQIFENIRLALRRLGADLGDVVRTRMYVTDMDHWKAIGQAHQEYFGTIRPATSLVEVRRLILPEILVEIEADAITSAEG